jgi:hypothetical protein
MCQLSHNNKSALQDKYSPDSNTLKTKIHCSTRPGTPTDEYKAEKATSIGSETVAGQEQLIQNECVSYHTTTNPHCKTSTHLIPTL